MVRIDPVSNAQSVVTSGGHLNGHFASNGMAFEDDTNLVSAEDTGEGGGDGVVRINTSTGQQRVVFVSDPLESQDIAVAGVSQIPPAPVVKANTDSFSTTTTAGPLQVGTPGVLGNDTDPLKQKLTATLDGPATNQAGTLDLHADGSFSYTRAAGFEGTARFFYRAHAPGRTSATGTILIDVKAAGLPLANPDKFSMASQAGQLKGSVLANDTDPWARSCTRSSPPAPWSMASSVSLPTGSSSTSPTPVSSAPRRSTTSPSRLTGVPPSGARSPSR